MAQDEQLLEYLTEPPTLSELLSTPVMRAIYGKHMISVYCPENLMFRDAVEKLYSLWDRGDTEAAKEQTRDIFKTFCSSDSPLEVNFASREKKAIAQAMQEGKFARSLFDRGLAAIDDDISRSLTSFWVTDIFLSYFQHKQLLDSLAANPTRVVDDAARMSSFQTSDGTDRERLLQNIRSAYGTREPVVLTRIFDVTSAFTYRVDAKGTQEQVGWGVQRKGFFYFYNMEEKLVVKASAAALLGKASARLGAGTHSEVTDDSSDDGVAASGCFSRNRAPAPKKGEVATPRGPALWYIRDSSQKEWGPIEEKDIKLFWRYDILPPGTHLRKADEKQCTPLLSYEDLRVFDPEQQIQLIDPTDLAGF